MMKHLFWYPWLFAALVVAILACLGTAVYLLMQFPSEIPANAHLVREGLYAAIL